MQYLRGEIVPSDVRLALKLMLSHEVYQMAMNFDEFKQLESSVRVSKTKYIPVVQFPMYVIFNTLLLIISNIFLFSIDRVIQELQSHTATLGCAEIHL